MKKLIYPFGFVFILLVFFWSCSSLPFPHTPRESLLIVSHKIESTVSSKEKISEITLYIEDLNEQKEAPDHKIKLSLTNNFSVSTLKPGIYRVFSADVRRSEIKLFGKTEMDTQPLDHRFSVDGGTIHLFQSKLEIQPDGSGGYELELVEYLENDEKIALYETLVNDRRWIGWERYTPVNFPRNIERIIEPGDDTSKEPDILNEADSPADTDSAAGPEG